MPTVGRGALTEPLAALSMLSMTIGHPGTSFGPDTYRQRIMQRCVVSEHGESMTLRAGH